MDKNKKIGYNTNKGRKLVNEREEKRKIMKVEKKAKKEKRASQAKGITLIALVITILIIIILATVTINFVFGEDGLVNMAELARDEAANSTDYESNARANLVGFMNEFIADLNGGSSGGGTDEPDVPEEPEKSEVQTAKDEGTVFSEKTVITDEKGNKITIPKGFKIPTDSGDTVQQGIVIEDVSASKDSEVQGSQYVWIPVGTFVKDDGSTSNEIKLGRYTFDSSGNTTEPLQYAENYTESVTIGSYYTETTTYDEGNESDGLDGRNATAKNLVEFINSTKPIEEGGNGGYYIGRYEASYASGATSTTEVGDYANCKAASKVSTRYRTSSDGSMLYNPGTLWNYITQPAASKVAINTYADSTSVKSDLMNSYAWDTAIVYIQEAGNSNYANATRKHTSLSNTGNLAEGIKDEVCKINDMASNVQEWTTEHSSYTYRSSAYPCVRRGGHYFVSSLCAASRNYNGATGSNHDIGFRLSLYM